MKPFFSIIIATYNRKDQVLAAIRTVLDQTFSDFEILVVDDGSTDGTIDFLRLRLPADDRLHLLKQENKERGAARNSGIRHSKGDYLVFMDSDDHIDREHLSVLHDHILRESFPDLITTKFDILNEKGGISTTPIHKLKQGYYDYRILLEGNTLGMYIAVRNGLSDFCFFEEDRIYSIVEDWLFNFSNLRFRKIFIIDQVTYHVHDHEGRSMNERSSILLPKMKLANNWITQHMGLDRKEQQGLSGFVNYLSAIHLYLDGKNIQALKEIRHAVSNNGVKRKYIVLLLKCLVGRKVALKMKQFFRA